MYRRKLRARGRPKNKPAPRPTQMNNQVTLVPTSVLEDIHRGMAAAQAAAAAASASGAPLFASEFSAAVSSSSITTDDSVLSSSLSSSSSSPSSSNSQQFFSSSSASSAAKKQQQQPRAQQTLFEQIMVSANRKLSTYRHSDERFPSDLPEIDLAALKQQHVQRRRRHEQHCSDAAGSSSATATTTTTTTTSHPGSGSLRSTLFPTSQPTANLSNRYAACAHPWHCAASDHQHRTSNLGTQSQPFLGKMHPNWVHTTDAGHSFCWLCGSYPIGGRDHHASFDRSHVALAYFFFLAVAMRREWSAQSVLQNSAKTFPGLWARAVSPPVRFSRQYSNLEFWLNLGEKGVASRFQSYRGVSSSTETNFHEIYDMSISGTNWLVERVQRLGPRSAVQTHVADDDRGAGNGGKKQQQLSAVSSYTLHHSDSERILAEQHKLEMEQRFGRGVSQADLRRHLMKSGILPRAEQLMQRMSNGGRTPYNVQFSPMWHAPSLGLQRQRLELQALLAAAMDSGAIFGGVAPRAVLGELSSAGVGQGEKAFRSDIARIISATLPSPSANVLAALCQKCWGRTNQGRLYDQLRIEHIWNNVVVANRTKNASSSSSSSSSSSPQPQPISTPRDGRSEKSAIMRQMITELHAHLARVNDASQDVPELAEEREAVHGTSIDPDACVDQPFEFLSAFHSAVTDSSSSSSCSEAQRNLLTAQLADMILSRLAQEAVLTISHIYMDRAWRVMALVGYPDVECLERIDYG